jgi:hypothetical protein
LNFDKGGKLASSLKTQSAFYTNAPGAVPNVKISKYVIFKPLVSDPDNYEEFYKYNNEEILTNLGYKF